MIDRKKKSIFELQKNSIARISAAIDGEIGTTARNALRAHQSPAASGLQVIVE
jgi:hypothetical protein